MNFKPFFFLQLLIIFFCRISPVVSQNYQIDLSSVEYPVLEKNFNMGHPGPSDKEIIPNSLFLTKGDEPFLPVMGEFHYNRYDHRFWREALLKMKASGVNIVSTYILWIYHEEIEGRMAWTESNNLRKFVQLCDEVDLLVHLRVGPYCNAEARNGGLPDWLMQKKYIRKRYNDPVYLNYVRKWYRSVSDQVEGLLYKDGGPIMGLQLENEYVTKGHVNAHLLELKKIAIEEGFDVPIYSMTHWMSSEYPKKELIPYAGYYIETPWFSGVDELPVSNFQFFSYNRLSDNIGTDIIKLEGDAQSLNSQEVESPYFTCEVGVGTPTFYHRRPIVPEEMAGANINLRLGAGVNLMGYYMYSGGSHKVGDLTTLESSTGRVSYDYQATLKEFGTLGVVMNETKKYNYFMNDFGRELAQQVAYLPTSNNNTENLQWAVRSYNNKGFLFCSNYLYKRDRENYEDVQFQIKLNNETLKIPRKPITVINGAYFTWPFNMEIEEIQLKYSTTQPISKIQNREDKLWVFFQDDDVPAEYLFSKERIKNITASNGNVSEEENGYFISGIKPGLDCVITIMQSNGSEIKLLTLNEEQSDNVWKIKDDKKEFLAITKSGLFFEKGEITLFSEENQQQLLIYPALPLSNKTNNLFSSFQFKKERKELPVEAVNYRPLEKSYWIKAKEKNTLNTINKDIDARSLSGIKQATFKCASSEKFSVFVNDKLIDLEQIGNYFSSDLTEVFKNGLNNIRVESDDALFQFIGEIEAFMNNGSRMVWNTDLTWESRTKETRLPVTVIGKQGKKGLPVFQWEKENGFNYYEIKLPTDMNFEKEEEMRLAISFKGDRADAYLGEELINDYLYDGSDWLIGINRFYERLQDNSLLIRVKSFESANPEIYFEKYVDKTRLDEARIEKVEMRPEYRFKVNYKE